MRTLSFILLCLIGLPVFGKGTYLTTSELVSAVFQTQSPESGVIWLTAARKAEAERLLGSSPVQARLRFHYLDDRRLWVLSEIGKEKPITFGVVTRAGTIERMDVMVFREIRGDEIRLPQYTAQYQGQMMTDTGDLTRPVDGISGATYSVRTMKKVAKLALLLDHWVSEDDVAAP